MSRVDVHPIPAAHLAPRPAAPLAPPPATTAATVTPAPGPDDPATDPDLTVQERRLPHPELHPLPASLQVSPDDPWADVYRPHRGASGRTLAATIPPGAEPAITPAPPSAQAALAQLATYADLEPARRATLAQALDTLGDQAFGGQAQRWIEERRWPHLAQACLLQDWTSLPTEAERLAALALAMPAVIDPAERQQRTAMASNLLALLRDQPDYQALLPAQRAQAEELLLLMPLHALAGGESPHDDPRFTQLLALLAALGAPALGDGVRTTALAEAARSMAADTGYDSYLAQEARGILATLAASPGLALLPVARAQQLLRLLGSPLLGQLTQHRSEFSSLLHSPEFRASDAPDQAQVLSDLLALQPGRPSVLGAPAGAFDARRRPYELGAPTAIASHPFATGAAPATRHTVTIGTRAIEVFMADQTASGLVNHTIEEVARGLAAMPPACFAQIAQVTVNPSTSPDDAYWQQEFNDPSFRAYMSVGADGLVDLWPQLPPPCSQECLDASLAHEEGHILSLRAWGYDYDADAWRRWRAALASDTLIPSAYGQNNAGEDFAETFKFYLQVRNQPTEGELRALMPARFALIDQLLAQLSGY